MLLSGAIYYSVAQAYLYPTKAFAYWLAYAGKNIKMRNEHKLYLALPTGPDLLFLLKMIRKDGLVPKQNNSEGKP